MSGTGVIQDDITNTTFIQTEVVRDVKEIQPLLVDEKISLDSDGTFTVNLAISQPTGNGKQVKGFLPRFATRITRFVIPPDTRFRGFAPGDVLTATNYAESTFSVECKQDTRDQLFAGVGVTSYFGMSADDASFIPGRTTSNSATRINILRVPYMMGMPQCLFYDYSYTKSAAAGTGSVPANATTDVARKMYPLNGYDDPESEASPQKFFFMPEVTFANHFVEIAFRTNTVPNGFNNTFPAFVTKDKNLEYFAGEYNTPPPAIKMFNGKGTEVKRPTRDKVNEVEMRKRFYCYLSEHMLDSVCEAILKLPVMFKSTFNLSTHPYGEDISYYQYWKRKLGTNLITFPLSTNAEHAVIIEEMRSHAQTAKTRPWSNSCFLNFLSTHFLLEVEDISSSAKLILKYTSESWNMQDIPLSQPGDNIPVVVNDMRGESAKLTNFLHPHLHGTGTAGTPKDLITTVGVKVEILTHATRIAMIASAYESATGVRLTEADAKTLNENFFLNDSVNTSVTNISVSSLSAFMTTVIGSVTQMVSFFANYYKVLFGLGSVTDADARADVKKAKNDVFRGVMITEYDHPEAMMGTFPHKLEGNMSGLTDKQSSVQMRQDIFKVDVSSNALHANYINATAITNITRITLDGTLDNPPEKSGTFGPGSGTIVVRTGISVNFEALMRHLATHVIGSPSNVGSGHKRPFNLSGRVRRAMHMMAASLAWPVDSAETIIVSHDIETDPIKGLIGKNSVADVAAPQASDYSNDNSVISTNSLFYSLMRLVSFNSTPVAAPVTLDGTSSYINNGYLPALVVGTSSDTDDLPVDYGTHVDSAYITSGPRAAWITSGAAAGTKQTIDRASLKWLNSTLPLANASIDTFGKFPMIIGVQIYVHSEGFETDSAGDTAKIVPDTIASAIKTVLDNMTMSTSITHNFINTSSVAGSYGNALELLRSAARNYGSTRDAATLSIVKTNLASTITAATTLYNDFVADRQTLYNNRELLIKRKIAINNVAGPKLSSMTAAANNDATWKTKTVARLDRLIGDSNTKGLAQCIYQYDTYILPRCLSILQELNKMRTAGWIKKWIEMPVADNNGAEFRDALNLAPVRPMIGGVFNWRINMHKPYTPETDGDEIENANVVVERYAIGTTRDSQGMPLPGAYGNVVTGGVIPGTNILTRCTDGVLVATDLMSTVDTTTSTWLFATWDSATNTMLFYALYGNPSNGFYNITQGGQFSALSSVQIEFCLRFYKKSQFTIVESDSTNSGAYVGDTGNIIRFPKSTKITATIRAFANEASGSLT